MNPYVDYSDRRRRYTGQHTHVMHLLRPDPSIQKNDADRKTASQDRTSAETDDAIVCRQCLHTITSPTERRIIGGAHAHTFANPEGIVFEIACYKNAWGCNYIGPSSSEFTWFSGHLWRIAVCASCHVHLGWRFTTADGHYFHGLIASHIMTKD